MKFLKISAGIFMFSALVFLACKRENSATLNSLAEERLGETPTELTVLSAPSVVCDVSTPNSITLKVCAGPSGAPNGFTIHWMTQPAFFANGGDWLPESSPALCVATFTGA